MARPTKFTRELGKACCALAAEGKSRYAVAGLAGIAHQTLTNWLDGLAESISDEDHAEFLANYERAESEVEAERVGTIARDASWQSKAWLLERSRKHWRIPKDDSDTANQNAPPQVVVVQVPAGSSVVQQPQQELP